MKTDLFQSCGHCWVFQICWHVECSTLTASSFRIWNSSPGILSPPLALFVAMLPKAHLTSHSRMSGSSLVITPSWLSGSWRSFLYSSSMYSYHLLISSDSVRSITISVLYCVHLCMKCSLGISNFLEEASAAAAKLLQSCPTLCNSMDCSLSSSFIHGFFKARVLEWVAISFSRGSSRPRDRTRVSRIVSKTLYLWATREVQF